MDPTATKVTDLVGEDRGVLGGDPRGSDHHQVNSVDPDGPQQNSPEDRGDPILPRIREGNGKVAQGAHTEKRTRRYL
jgi:hypothetical protein